MIRLGSLAGYPFDGPRVLAGWSPPAAPAVYVVLYRPEPDRERYAVIFVGHSEDLSTEGFPFRHPAAPCWIRRAGGKYGVHVATYQIPGGGPGHRAQVADELIALYKPQCNDRQVDPAWQDRWIGSYEAPTTGPLTTGRQPGGGLGSLPSTRTEPNTPPDGHPPTGS